jgi:hypothetical protein
LPKEAATAAANAIIPEGGTIFDVIHPSPADAAAADAQRALQRAAADAAAADAAAMPPPSPVMHEATAEPEAEPRITPALREPSLPPTQEQLARLVRPPFPPPPKPKGNQGLRQPNLAPSREQLVRLGFQCPDITPEVARIGQTEGYEPLSQNPGDPLPPAHTMGQLEPTSCWGCSWEIFNNVEMANTRRAPLVKLTCERCSFTNHGPEWTPHMFTKQVKCPYCSSPRIRPFMRQRLGTDDETIITRTQCADCNMKITRAMIIGPAG